MASQTLVTPNSSVEILREVGHDLVRGLEKSNLPVARGFLLYSPTESCWRLVLGSPAVKKLGPRRFYVKLNNLLKREAALSLDFVQVRDMQDPRFQDLDRQTLHWSANRRVNLHVTSVGPDRPGGNSSRLSGTGGKSSSSKVATRKK